MTDFGNIQGPGAGNPSVRTGPIGRIGRASDGADRVAGATDDRRVRGTDSVTLSDAARAASRPAEADSVPPLPTDPARASLVENVRAEIEAGVYDADAWLDRAIDGLILDISGNSSGDMTGGMTGQTPPRG